MNKQIVIAAVAGLAAGLVLGSLAVKVQLMDQALRSQAGRLSQIEGSLAQVVQFINNNARPAPEHGENAP